MKKNEMDALRQKAVGYFERAGIVLTPAEREAIEVTDYELGRFEDIGLFLLTYFNTGRSSARELVLLPNQACPEHFHPPFIDDAGENIGKEETFRCRMGKVYLYVDGEPTPNPQAKPPAFHGDFFKVRHEVALNPGDQYTLYPGTKHWFIAGPEGAIVSEFSTRIKDDADVFTDPSLSRFSRIEEG
ncbi:MAG TPA: D-lyxose/D-mannose family sugar isomerase [Candidatus Hydrogenedentes bacterium]|nr:D-lyxose/D-mannose family sugar isomerase [Candidatus Hydrogenedentota bacterium]HOS01547.1 D-lyxose/D-mannose family sugar isomerase [Candidatus Hydrogenedentota bacterium]